MTEPSHAVFLSYAQQDARAVQRICEALRAAGIPVFLDQSELRGGDAWDQKIRQEIHDCALFIPIVSQHTQERLEGYFRHEWKLAIERAHHMAEQKPFLLPVVVDGTRDQEALVPDAFRAVQWTRLPAGETPPAFVERIQRLLSPATSTTIQLANAQFGAAGISQGPVRASSPALKRGLLVAVAVLVLGLMAYFAVEKLWISKPSVSAPTVAADPAPAAFTPPPHSIAVLPFVNMSGDKDQEYFSDGLAEELLDLLSQVPDLRVPARTSSFYFKGRNDDIATIAQKLRVAHLLEGSVRRSGKRIRVTAQLIRADNGYHLWSKTYDRVDNDIFEVQDEIANAVVTALKAQLLSAQPLASRHRSDSTEAYTAYLLGNQLRQRDTPESNRQALEAYRHAVALDPNYAAAYAGVSDAEWRVADMATAEAAAYQRSREAAEQAITLAPDLADGYWARGSLRVTYNYDWPGAESDFKKALELDPNDVRVLRDYGTLLAIRSKTTEALAAMGKSVALDPLSADTWLQLALLQVDLGQLTEAKQSAQHLEAVHPGSWQTRRVVGEIALADGRAEDALAEFRKVDTSGWKLIGGAMAEHTLGHAAASQAALEELIRTRSATSAYQIAEVYAWRGERDAAFMWLERAHRQRDGGMAYLPYDHFLAPLRDDPRYRALLKKMNLT